MLRERKYNIGVMPQMFGLSFKLLIMMGIAAVVSVIVLILLVLFTGAGWFSPLILALPIGLYVVFVTAGKKVKGSIEAVKTGAWLHELEAAMLQRKIEKRLGINGKEIK